jgi:hypothetical protein
MGLLEQYPPSRHQKERPCIPMRRSAEVLRAGEISGGIYIFSTPLFMWGDGCHPVSPRE